ncbi:hypothetical protein BWD07_01415 [Neisseria canis]|uniref:Membrane protein n=2 Tax=Neisseria canis TaxID=493 RepID=A0A1X3D168_9NEIS|nr:hypothetical protein BWD07_01415 [Neisseria canis]VEF01782.1 membrane protein [Neisseria canis]
MPGDLGLWCLLLYIAVFLYTSFKEGMFQWLWASVLLWLGISVLLGKVLPGVAGLTHVTAFYVPHFYITVASLFFFVHKWFRVPEKNVWITDSGVFISLFAVTGALMQVAFWCLCGLVWLNYPHGISVYILPALLQMYVLEPEYWIGMQILLILLFYLHRVVVEKQPGNVFSLGQLQSGFLLSLLFQVVWVAASMPHFRH